VGKLPENTDKNGAERILICENGSLPGQNHKKTFFLLEVIPQTVVMKKYWRIRTKSGPKIIFRARLGKFGQNSFAPPEMCLLLCEQEHWNLLTLERLLKFFLVIHVCDQS